MERGGPAEGDCAAEAGRSDEQTDRERRTAASTDADGTSHWLAPTGRTEHHHQAMPCTGRAALLGCDVDVDVEQAHDAPYGRRVILTQRVINRIAYFAEERPADIDRATLLSPAHDAPASDVGATNHRYAPRA